jgi:hypothetical protein
MCIADTSQLLRQQAFTYHGTADAARIFYSWFQRPQLAAKLHIGWRVLSITYLCNLWYVFIRMCNGLRYNSRQSTPALLLHWPLRRTSCCQPINVGPRQPLHVTLAIRVDI